MQPILVSYPLELIHLDFLTLGGKTDDNRSVNNLVVTDHFTKYVQVYVPPTHTAPPGPYGKVSWYIINGLKRFSLIKESLLRTI